MHFQRDQWASWSALSFWECGNVFQAEWQFPSLQTFSGLLINCLFKPSWCQSKWLRFQGDKKFRREPNEEVFSPKRQSLSGYLSFLWRATATTTRVNFSQVAAVFVSSLGRRLSKKYHVSSFPDTRRRRELKCQFLDQASRVKSKTV